MSLHACHILDDGNICQVQPIRVAWGSWLRLGWELVEVALMSVAIGSTGRGCAPGFVKVYRAVLHIGPIKVCFGSDMLDEEDTEEIELLDAGELVPFDGPPPLPVLPCL